VTSEAVGIMYVIAVRKIQMLSGPTVLLEGCSYLI
jgi:hypothetical protein